MNKPNNSLRFIYLDKIYKLSSYFFFINLILFGSNLCKDIFLNTNPTGDEGKYLNDLIQAKEMGISNVILEGTSIPYLILSFYLNEIIGDPLLALKVTSLIVGILLLLVLVKFNNKFLHLNSIIRNSGFLWISYLFFIQATIFMGVNDILLDLFGTLFFVSLILPKVRPIKKILLAGIFLALMLLTRKMALTYIFVFFLIYFVLSILIRKHSFINLKNGVKIFFVFISFFLAFNTFSLIEQGTLSFDDKILKGKVNWAQWDYHNALLIDAGVQERFSHVSIKETENFLDENGKNSLPSTFLEMIFFKPSLTIKEFFIDMVVGFKYLIRQTGLLIFPFLIYLFLRIKKIFKTKSVTPIDFVYLFSFLYFVIISFVVVTNIQARWFMLFLPITILLIAKDLNKLPRQDQLIFSILNNIFLIIMCIPYLLHNLNEFFS